MTNLATRATTPAIGRQKVTEPNDVATASQIEGPTAAQILDQIKEKQRELKSQLVAKPPEIPEPAPTPDPVSPAPAAEPSDANKPAEPVPESSAGVAPGPSGNDKPEWKAWIEKKGFKSTEDMVRSMRELERELHRRGKGNGADAPPQAMPAPTQQPRPDYPVSGYPSPRPAQVSEEEIAKRYNLDPEDLRRVGPLVADIAANISAQQIGPLMSQLNRVNREVARNAELQGLKEDPAFQDPRVQYEMHRILETDPSILQNEPAPYRYAFNESLRILGRRILEGSIETVPTGKTNSGQPPYPTNPPKTAGGGSSGAPGQGAGVTSTGQISAEKFASLPSAEQRKILASLGKITPEY
jgi:hypothetical protein